MPPLTMRGRYLMREYWSDSDLFLRLTAEEREVYIGLWMLADDAGWMPRDVPAIAASLFRYEDRAPREARLTTVLARLHDLGKVESLRCRCLHLPAVARYPRAGRKSNEHEQNHQTHSKRSNGIQRDLKPSPVVNPTLSLPDVAGAHEPDASGAGSSLTDKLVAAGVKPSLVGRAS
jgi:hypothetical protein